MKKTTREKRPAVSAARTKRPAVSAARTKRGIYTAAVSALVVAIVIAFNLVVGSIPSGTLEYDLSGRDLYTVSGLSAAYLKTLDKDVNIVVLAQSSAIDKHLLKFINNYARLSPRLKLQIIDPILDPTAQSTYDAKENNVVVKCDATGKSKILNLAGFQGYVDGLILYDAQAYQYSGQLNPVAVDADGQLTSAVSYVTSTVTNKMYLLTGHGEGSQGNGQSGSILGTNAASLITKANIQTANLNLLTDGKIPDDCQLLVCYNPAKDLTNDERTMLENYLRTGGKFLLILDAPQLKNINALLAVYGLQMQNGYVGDNDRSYKAYAAQYGVYCIYPILSSGSDVTSGITANALLRYARGMTQITPERRGSTVTPFMTTSDNGVLAVDQNNITKGKYIIGATATETFADKPGVTTRLTVITAADLTNDQISTSLANMDIFMNAVAKNYSEVQNTSVPSKSLSVRPVTVSHPLLWIVLFVVVIPLAVLVIGLVTWIRRRNR